MSALLPVPKYGEDQLPQLVVRRKGEWEGGVTRVLGFVVRLGVFFGVKAASRFLNDFHSVFPWQEEVLWQSRGSRRITYGAWLHERLHAWHYGELGLWRSLWVYAWHRDQFEAIGYAAEVAAGYRTLAGAAKKMADPIYGIGNATVLLMEYAHALSEAGWTVERLRAEAEQ